MKYLKYFEYESTTMIPGTIIPGSIIVIKNKFKITEGSYVLLETEAWSSLDFYSPYGKIIGITNDLYSPIIVEGQLKNDFNFLRADANNILRLLTSEEIDQFELNKKSNKFNI